jgi:hypothetical protein
MNELIQKVQERTGLSEDKARQAVQVVVEQLKSRLPGPVAGELDKFAGGQTGGVGSDLGGIFGKKTA